LSAPDWAPRAVIFGCRGLTLDRQEAALFRAVDPLGFILFARNIADPDQVRALVTALRHSVGWPAPVLIDQEGGRVQRLRPPFWRAAPPAAVFGTLAARDPEAGLRAAWINARLMAAELAALDIDIDCAPVLDNPMPGAHDVIGDRAFGQDPVMIGLLGHAVLDGLMAGGVQAVIKHIPGHGRAAADSHEACPVVRADAAALEARDLPPFRAMADAPFAMTAHIRYTAWDEKRPATLSPIVIERVIRGEIGFRGALLSDDIGMKALEGSLGERAQAAQAAGCDVVLHCSGDLAEMKQVAEATSCLKEPSLIRLATARGRRRPPEPADLPELQRELGALLAGAAGR
jgi:beta-N-acetylhexosaminidase